ncbi:MAG: hypothetical protein D3909_10725, partial [Candidatus Electrothrix sp. ATG1]|nr:hypothetical protein [Candidatus Electrothrix sp. ATG1]
MRLTLTQKLLLALLLANTVLVTVMAVASNRSFRRGFMGYLRQVELRQLDDIAQALSTNYAAQGSWDFLRHDLRVWRQYLSYLPGVQAVKTKKNQSSRRPPHRPPPRGIHGPPSE